MRGEVVDSVDEDVGEPVGLLAVWEPEQDQVARVSLDERGRGGLPAGTDDQIALHAARDTPGGVVGACIDRGHSGDPGESLTQLTAGLAAGPLGLEHDPLSGQLALG